MKRLVLTLESPAHNLALDEALLDWLEQDHAGATGSASALGLDDEVLRIWESPVPMVVVGRSSRLEEEVDQAACAKYGVPIFRRPSGGATVVIGPGCLMFALILSCRRRPELRAVDRAHAFVLDRHVELLMPHFPTIRKAGTSDLVLAGDANADTWKKVSGNSMRLKRSHLLYHGTFLYNFDLSLLSKCLRMPSRQPDYRQARPHDQFVANLSIARMALEESLLATWAADEELPTWPHSMVHSLAEKYG